MDLGALLYALGQSLPAAAGAAAGAVVASILQAIVAGKRSRAGEERAGGRLEPVPREAGGSCSELARASAKLDLPEFGSFEDFVKGMTFEEGVVFSSDGLVVENCSSRGVVLAPYTMEAVRALERAGIEVRSAILKLNDGYALLVRIGKSGSRELYAFLRHALPPSLSAPERLVEVLRACLAEEGVGIE